MGNYYDQYKAMYEEAKAAGTIRLFANQPDVWMMMNYSADHNLDPWNDQYESHLLKLKEVDEQMYNVMVTAFNDFMNNHDKFFNIKETSSSNAPSHLRTFVITENKTGVANEHNPLWDV